MGTITQRRVVRVPRRGGPEVIEIAFEDLAALNDGEVRVRVEAVGLNHAETLIRSGKYAVRVPFPFAAGGEGSGTVVEATSAANLPIGTRVCWGAILGSCADFLTAPASMVVKIPDALSFEDAACLPVAGLTAGGLARVWPLSSGSRAVVWGAAGAVGRMLVSLLADRGVDVIGIATGDRTKAVRACGASLAIDRLREDVLAAVSSHTNGHGATVVFDPIGAATFQTSLELLAPCGCLVNYGELCGPVPAIDLHQLFPNSVFVTKYNGTQWVQGPGEFAKLISHALDLAVKRRAVISPVAGRFRLDDAVEAYRLLESNSPGKVLVIPASDK